MKCKNCCEEVLETDNFCSYCRAKLNENCYYCWVKRKQHYNCGFEHCPGYKLLIEECRKKKNKN